MDYDDILEELCVDKIAEEVVNNNYGRSVEEICFLIEQEYAKYKSEIWFPNDTILIHPSVKTRRAAKYYETVNGVIVSPKNLYVNYHALLINESKNTKYVLSKPLIFDIHDKYPMNISELEKINLDISLKKLRNH